MKSSVFKNKRERKRLVFYCAMLALPLLQVAVFYFGVNINSLALSFQQFNYDTGAYEFTAGFDNFKRFFVEWSTTLDYRIGLRNSAIFFLSTTVICMVLALFFSYFIYKKGPANKFFRVVLFLPSIISGIVMVIFYQYFVDTFVPSIIEKIIGAKEYSIQGLLSNPKTAVFTLILYNVIMGFGSNVLLLTGDMSSISESVIEAAKIDGANSWQEFTRVVFPQIYQTFSTLAVVALAGFFTNQYNIFSFWGGNAQSKYVNIGYLLYKQTQRASFGEYPYLATLGVIMTIIIVPITFAVRKILAKVGPSNE